jgi:general stress protein YciG
MTTNHDKDSSKKGDTSNRGFASMDEDKQKEIASKGGKAAHEKGTAHEFDSKEAREAGKKGGENSHGGGGQSDNKGSHSAKDSSSSTRGGSSEQHAKAGSQSHKNK